MKWNEMKWNEMKWNEMKWNETIILGVEGSNSIHNIQYQLHSYNKNLKI